MIKIRKAHRQLGFYIWFYSVLFGSKFQDRNFHGVVVGLYEQSIESWVGLE